MGFYESGLVEGYPLFTAADAAKMGRTGPAWSEQTTIVAILLVMVAVAYWWGRE